MGTTGECLCGAVRFEVARFVGPFELCHCTRCRRAFGSAYAALIGVRREDFEWRAGEDRIRQYEAPVRAFPPGYRTAFCDTCGSPVPVVPEGADWFEVPAGLLDEGFAEPPDRHIYVDYVSRWEKIEDGYPRLSERELVKLRLASIEGGGRDRS